MIILAKIMEHATAIWKTTLALVLRNLQDKTVKVRLQNLYLLIYFLSISIHNFFILILYHERVPS